MKKKICFIGFNLFSMGGAERVTIRLANDLCEKYETYILSMCEIENKGDTFVDEKIKVKSFQMPSNIQVRSSLKLFFKLRKFLNENKIDIVFIAGSLPVPLMFILKPFINSKTVFCDHESIKNRDKKSILFRKLACGSSDRVVVLTEETIQDYVYEVSADRNKLVQIYNYLDERLISECDSYDINSKKIITAGRFGPEKGFDMLVDVADMVFKRHPDWTWDLFGDGEEFKKIKDLVIDKGLENNVILKGATNKIYEKYKDYAMYVLPSYREGLPLVLLEAKANRLPIVSFDVSTGPREIVRDNQDGFLIPCYNKEQMADKICTLIENPKLRQQFSSRSYDNLNLFRKETILNKWIELIEGMR